jgi:ElaB/YqjD/DUF883 family membrane-anchored ribosome-binding protein
MQTNTSNFEDAVTNPEISRRASDVASNLKDKVSDLGRTAVDKIDQSRRSAADGLESAANAMHDKADNVSNLAHSTAHRMSSTAGYVRDHDVKSMMGDLGHLVRNNPGPALLSAAVVGFLVGRAFSSND